MNAYELAEIMETHDGSQVWNHGLEIATMLRQQADHIIKLGDDLFAERRECLKLENRIAELEKLLEEMKYEKSSGVYDYPVKQLSDEEVDKLAEYHGIDSLYETGRIDFARAIIKGITK